MNQQVKSLQAALDRILAEDPDLAMEIQGTHPTVAAALPSVGALEVIGRPRAPIDEATLLGSLEAIVKKKGRPVLTVRNDDFAFSATDVESEVWRNRLKDAHDRLKAAIPSVGRVEVTNNPNYEWVGTAWLVDEDIAVTNRHVAGEFAVQKGSKFVFRIDTDGLMASCVDFRQEDGVEETGVFAVTEVLYIEPDPGPDLAFLRVVQESGSDRLSPPIRFSRKRPAAKQFIAAIGYPARDSRVTDPTLMGRIFEETYDKKRLAPGVVIEFKNDVLKHDASTLGGNSGSVLVDLETGEAVGLHRAGIYLSANYAVPAWVLVDRLASFKSGKSSKITVPGTIGSRTAPKTGAVQQRGRAPELREFPETKA